MISQENSFDVFYDIYKDDPRFNFVKYDDRGHDYVYYSENSRKYKDGFNKGFDEYLNSLDEEFTAKIKESYFNDNLDKKSLYDLDLELMNKIVEFYDSYVK
ncbi:MAG: alpha/beta hydrolase, partial [Tissierellia bacterium]|nr:alpha/beta hydrolase [Tissierellia bacterium]